MKIHLVDGTYELFRSFYGAPPARSPSGVEVGATRGLIRTFLALIEPGRFDGGASHVGIAFDTVIESFRNDLFDGYKTGAGIDPALWNQFPLAERASRALGFVTWSMTEMEADDAIATAAARFAAQTSVEEVVICSPDKDMAQCLGENVIMLDRRRKTTLDVAGATEKYGVPPESIPDWLALVGDDADGIPGIPKWGAKSAAVVLSHYRTIDAIPDSESDWTIRVRGAAALAEQLRNRKDDALLYRKLATLRTDAPLSEDIDALEWKGAHREDLAQLCEEIGESKLMERVPRFRAD